MDAEDEEQERDMASLKSPKAASDDEEQDDDIEGKRGVILLRRTDMFSKLWHFGMDGLNSFSRVMRTRNLASTGKAWRLYLNG